ncbi:carbohydrate kinase [Polaribacter reichenbachii]|uniref:Carbohydrate kinase n=1 Tax=Polaribacter reichenbachii TaxID=996801 RepID=A0A1B8U6N3_9FLAO|nr:FGGY family carbohydrate kinase [Polaribacter reichenbachii]APZ46060.1 carbohydrate kinase [Polaribacter reichenbachii]AUC19922.1 carbohydrate kinase [Polaribacter reichenbachii]OBY67534.1 carbohydrate kinase [Polaribacter reichenbachii]
MAQRVTAIFDIGKTNKKFFLFDKNYNEVYREYTSFKEIVDEDGYATENLEALQNWLKEVFYRLLNNKDYIIKAINFSTYGASLVHLDETGKVLTPLYNYTKEIDTHLVDSFYKKYGPELDLTRITGSPKSGLLNSGMQLYWLKKTKPEIFKKIKYSLHLPQYLSYVFTGIPISDYTSIGCHTSLWNYEKSDYHSWVYNEEIHKILPPLIATETSINMNYNGKRIKVGVGIHDSSSALIPYVRSVKKPFILVSTGTWSIALNPFSDAPLTTEETAAGCINYMRINGKPVKSSRLFLGNEYKLQVKELSKKFNVDIDYHKTVEFNYSTYLEIIKEFQYCFKWKSFSDKNMPTKTKYSYNTFEYAYHQLMIELVQLQVKSIKKIANTHDINRLYVDGGFTDNDLYIKLLSHNLREMKLRTTKASLGSALGAAIAISDTKLNSKFLRKNYALKKHVPFIIK